MMLAALCLMLIVSPSHAGETSLRPGETLLRPGETPLPQHETPSPPGETPSHAGESFPPPDPAEAAATASASQEAQKWLLLIDADKFAESWTPMAEVFKREATQDQWVQSLTGIREIIGKRIMRSQQSATFSNTVRGAPRGEYVTLTYATQFEKVPPATETVLAAKDADGTWRIAGYAVKKTAQETK